jgi:RNA recognition motif-containing protein
MKSGKNLGYGFVRFSRQDCAEAAIKAMNVYCYICIYIGFKKNSKLKGKKITVGYSKVSTKINSSTVPVAGVYVKNLESSVTSEQLFNMFLPFGEIREAKGTCKFL